MKKLIIYLIMACSVLLLACDNKDNTIIDWKATTEYIFKNECSQTVTISSYAMYFDKDEWKEHYSSVFVIEPGKEYMKSTSYMGGPFIDPFDWYGSHDRDEDYAVVSNGVSEFTHYYKDNDDLYNLEKYELVSESEYKRTYAYTFRDGDFK